MPGAWLIEERDTRPHSISPVAQNLWSIISISMEGRLVTIAQAEESGCQATSRSPWSESTKSREGELLVEDDIGKGGHPAGTAQTHVCRQYRIQFHAGYDF